MILRVVCDPEVNLGQLPGGGEEVSCSKAQLMGSKDVREAPDACLTDSVVIGRCMMSAHV